MKKTNVILLGLAIFSAVVFSSGCSKKSKAKNTLLVGKDAAISVANPLILIGIEKGYFSEYDLDVVIQGVDRSGMFESLSIGKLDATYAELIPELSYGAQGADVTVFGGTQSGGMGIMANKAVAEEVKDINNWKGKTLGVKLLSTSEMITKNVLSKRYGFEIDKDVKYKFFDGDASLILALTRGTVDIAFVSQNYIESGEAQGAVYLYPETFLEPDYVCCRQTANGTNIAKNRDVYKSYLKGQIRSYKDYITNEDEAVNSVSKASGQTVDYVRRFIYDTEGSQDTKFNPDPNYNGVSGVYDVLLGWNYVASQRPLYEFFDISIYADALKEIIAQFPEDEFYKNMKTYFVEHNNSYPEFEKLI